MTLYRISRVAPRPDHGARISDDGARPMTGNPTEAPQSAAALRMKMLEREMEESTRREQQRAAEQAKREAMLARFLADEVTEEESAMIRRLVLRAASEGKMEALVYSFPSELCSDGGRAINSGDSDWPATLRGKALALYERFKAVAQPQGYKLKAMIINFPGGMPGDVGFFISWAPEAV
jgi:hypothetical protein